MRINVFADILERINYDPTPAFGVKTTMKKAKRESEIEETTTRTPGWKSGQSVVEITKKKGYVLERFLYPDPPVLSDFDRLDAYQLDMILDEGRRTLERLGLPTDLTPPSSLPDVKNLPEAARWTWQCQQLPELSEGRLAGELVWSLSSLFNIEELEEHLPLIRKVVTSYANFRVAEINALAASGAAAIVGRSAGPAARSAKSKKMGAVICRKAALYWRYHPNYENDASNTAQQISGQVQDELKAAGLVSEAGLSDKTIADYIRRGIKDGFFRNGHFGDENGHS